MEKLWLLDLLIGVGLFFGYKLIFTATPVFKKLILSKQTKKYIFAITAGITLIAPEPAVLILLFLFSTELLWKYLIKLSFDNA